MVSEDQNGSDLRSAPQRSLESCAAWIRIEHIDAEFSGLMPLLLCGSGENCGLTSSGFRYCCERQQSRAGPEYKCDQRLSFGGCNNCNQGAKESQRQCQSGVPGPCSKPNILL